MLPAISLATYSVRNALRNVRNALRNVRNVQRSGSSGAKVKVNMGAAPPQVGGFAKKEEKGPV